MLHSSRPSVERPIVAEGRSLARDSGLERSADTAVEGADLARIELAGSLSRIESRPPKRLVGVDVSDPGEGSLIEQSGLDRSPSAREPFGQLGGRESALERLEAETGRKVRVELVCVQDEPGSEPANVPVRDVRSVV